MVNAKLGSDFENEFAEILNNNGYFSHVVARSKSGSQPFDVFSCKGNTPKVFDCKTLNNTSGLFPIKRVEENQILAWKKYEECGNTDFNLAIKWDNKIYIIPFWTINFNKSSLDLKEQYWWYDYANKN